MGRVEVSGGDPFYVGVDGVGHLVRSLGPAEAERLEPGGYYPSTGPLLVVGKGYVSGLKVRTRDVNVTTPFHVRRVATVGATFLFAIRVSGGRHRG
jgi:hypothetical protein